MVVICVMLLDCGLKFDFGLNLLMGEVMLITYKEFLEKLDEKGISSLKAAYLLAVGVVRQPITLKKRDKGQLFLFDDFDIMCVEEILALHMDLSPNDIRNKRFASIATDAIEKQNSGMSSDSESALRLAASIEIKKHGKRKYNIEKILGQKPKMGWLRRLLAYLTTFSTYTVKVNEGELLTLLSTSAVAASMVPGILVAALFPRFKHLYEPSLQNQCLERYVSAYPHLGWCVMNHESELIEEFFRIEPHLPKWPLSQALAFLTEIETKYADLNKKVIQYSDLFDPNGLIIKHLITVMIYEPYMSTLLAADKRAKKEFDEELEALSGVVPEAFKGLLSQAK